MPDDGRSARIAAMSDAEIAPIFAVAMRARRLDPSQGTAEDAAALTLARRIARVRFRWFIAYVTADDEQPYQFDRFHESVIAELQAVFDGGEARLLLAAPPRSGKSRLCAVLFPAFFIGARPSSRVIIASYSQELAREHLREARSTFLSRAFHEVFPACALADDGMAADLLRTTVGGACRATGSGGILTGLGADLLVLDDLIKGYDDAASELMRTSLWSWYTMSARTRLSPKGAIVAIGTRWHHADVLGKLVAASEDGSGEPWRHLVFPAIDREGNALWPARFPLAALHALKATLGQTQWQALYQGSPSPIGGGFFKSEWFRYCKPEFMGPERDLLTCMVTDFALSEGDGDWSVIAVLSINPEGNVFVRHLWRERMTMDATLDALLSICAKWKPSAWAYEMDMIMKSALPLIRQRMVQHKVNVWHIQHTASASKVQKAGPLQGILEQRGLYLPADAAWADALIAEATEFPAGQHDDQVDALAHLGRAWLKLRPKSVTEEKRVAEGLCLQALWESQPKRQGERV